MTIDLRIPLLLSAGALALGLATPPAHAQEGVDMRVVKSPTCGCCSAWVAIAEGQGYEVVAVDLDDVSEVKRALGVPEPLWACHTATVEGYVVEGHMPFEAIEKLPRRAPRHPRHRRARHADGLARHGRRPAGRLRRDRLGQRGRDGRGVPHGRRGLMSRATLRGAR